MIGGAHVGYNLQINQWVIGLEGSVDGTSLSNTAVGAFGGSTLTAHTNADIQGSIRGRLGVALDRALIYATGGVAFGGFNTDVSLSAPPFFASASRSNTRVGWTVGGGIEYAITNNWSIRAEYRYSDFGTIRNGDLAGCPRLPFLHVITLPKTRSRPASATSSTCGIRTRSSRNIKPPAPASTKTKPGLAAGFFVRLYGL